MVVKEEEGEGGGEEEGEVVVVDEEEEKNFELNAYLLYPHSLHGISQVRARLLNEHMQWQLIGGCRRR